MSRSVLTRLEELFGKMYPSRKAFYEWVHGNSRPEGVSEPWLRPWCTMALNLNVGEIEAHTDSRNFEHDLAFVVVWGDFDGGEVVFPGLGPGVTLQVQKGTCMCAKHLC